MEQVVVTLTSDRDGRTTEKSFKRPVGERRPLSYPRFDLAAAGGTCSAWMATG